MHSALLGLALAVAAPVPVVEKVTPPKGPPPAYAIAVMKDGKLQVQQAVEVHEARTEYRQVNVVRQGKTVTQNVPVQVTVKRTVYRTVQADKPKAYDTTGKAIDAGRLAELLKRETAVLISSDGRPLDPFYLRTVKDGTLILVLGNTTPVAPPMPPPSIRGETVPLPRALPIPIPKR